VSKPSRFKERFAAIPVRVMESEAYRTLEHAPRSALLVLASQYLGVANGVQNLGRGVCRRYGLDHSNAHRSAKILEDRQLIIRTYKAKYTVSHARIPTMWALGWLDITHRNNDLLVYKEKTSNAWASWDPSKVHKPENRSGTKRSNRPNTVALDAAVAEQNCGIPATQAANTAALNANLLRI